MSSKHVKQEMTKILERIKKFEGITVDRDF